VWLLAQAPPESALRPFTLLGDGIAVALAALLFVLVHTGHGPNGEVLVGEWFEMHGHAYETWLVIDGLSATMVLLTTVLIATVRLFAVRYLHKDRGYFRFFLLTQLYALGSLTVFLAGSLDLLLAGWELVGLTSVLLIAFFRQRPEPVRNALRVFASYRMADIALLLAVSLSIHHIGDARWSQVAALPLEGGIASTLLPCLIVLAACGKSSQGPFFGWLPRALEGPTPSTAVFYGAISVHAGVYLLIRNASIIAASPVATGLLLVLGLAGAFAATWVGRAQTDVKSSLAYATMAQLGIMFAEVALGLTSLATWHVVGHACWRTSEFLRAPSALRDFDEWHNAVGIGAAARTGQDATRRFEPAYALALFRMNYDAVIDRFVVAPLLALSRGLRSIDARLAREPSRGQLRQSA
jgi:NADH:ubiquinone oxidoreductase subunit 5 (subunit L)/multisubunit Na+/H+ antiporter MnhA subunit